MECEHVIKRKTRGPAWPSFNRFFYSVHCTSIAITNLKQPVTATMESGQYRGMNVATVDTFGALDLELHMVLTRCLAIFSLLPTVTIAPISDTLSAVKQH